MTKNQTGFALLIFLIVLMAIAGGVGAKLLGSKIEAVNQNKTSKDYDVMQKAKKALLNYAVSYSVDGNLYEMGRLPCPDRSFVTVPPEGEQEGTCGVRHANSAGYLPWKTLGIDMLVDGNGECLWYVVSGDYKKGATSADMLNEDSNGLLWVQDENGQAYHGTDPGDRPIALIIAPGGILQGQNRVLADPGMVFCRGNYTEANYIESGGSVNYAADHVNTADAIWTYVYGSLTSRLENSNFNDKMVWISRNEYWDAVKAQQDLDAGVVGSPINQLTSDLAQCFADYGGHPDNNENWLPWPAAIDLAEYRNDFDNGGANEYIDQDGTVLGSASLIGRFPQDISNTDFAETNLPGAPISTPPNMADVMASCLTANQKLLWQNWKDHFFYVVSPDFEMLHGITSALASSCSGAGDCITVDGVDNDFAAMVLYSNSVSAAQSRDSEPVDADEKNVLANSLGPENADLDIDYLTTDGDLAYCIQVVANSFFSVTNCS